MNAKKFAIAHLSANAVRVCIGAVSECKTKVELLAVGKADTKSFRSGGIIHRENLINAIKNAIEMAEKMANCRIRSVEVCFSSPELIGLNRGGQIDLNHSEVIDERHMYEVLKRAKNNSVLNNNYYVTEFFPQLIWLDDDNITFEDVLGMTNANQLKVSYHLVGLPTTVVEDIYAIFSDSSINVTVDRITCDAVAGAEYALIDDEKERGVLYVNIGASTTNFCLYKQNLILASGCLRMGGDEITLDLVSKFSISHAEAERLKRHHAHLILGDDSKKNFIDIQSDAENGVIGEYLLSEIVASHYDRLFDEIVKQLDAANLLGAFPAGVVLAGEGSQIKDIAPYLKRKWGTPTHLTNQNERVVLHEDCQYKSHEKQVAQALTERGFQMVFGTLLHHANKSRCYCDRIHLVPEENHGFFARIKQKFSKFATSLKEIA